MNLVEEQNQLVHHIDTVLARLGEHYGVKGHKHFIWRKAEGRLSAGQVKFRSWTSQQGYLWLYFNWRTFKSKKETYKAMFGSPLKIQRHAASVALKAGNTKP